MISRYEILSAFVADISREISKISAEEMRRYGLRGSSAKYLLVMLVHGVPMTATKLSQLSGRDKADVSRMMTIMETKGLVVKRGDNRNRYRGLLLLTDTGKQAARFVQERARVAVDLAGGSLSEGDRTVFYEVLETIAGNLREMSRDGLPTE